MFGLASVDGFVNEDHKDLSVCVVQMLSSNTNCSVDFPFTLELLVESSTAGKNPDCQICAPLSFT